MLYRGTFLAAFIFPLMALANSPWQLVSIRFLSAALGIITSAVGMFGVSMGLEGFFRGRLAWPLRLLSVAGGLLLIYPGLATDVIGVLLVGGIVAVQWVRGKRAAAA